MANRFKENEPKNEVKKTSEKKTTPETSDAIFITAEKKEARSKRVNLLVKPSVYAAAKQKCDKLGISINECINQFLAKWSEE